MLGLTLAADQVARLLDYVELLVRWNRVYNLTAIHDPRDMLAAHVLDSLSIADLVGGAPTGAVVDVGTGPGLPGIPLAIVHAHRRFELVDAVAKKVSFLQQAKTTLKLTNATPHHARVEALTLADVPALIVSRAFADLQTMLRSIDALASQRTVVIAMKGVLPTDEIAAIPDAWRVVEVKPLDVPMLGAQRCAIVLRRVGPVEP